MDVDIDMDMKMNMNRDMKIVRDDARIKYKLIGFMVYF
jgi:hypothetical protein